MVEDFRLAYRLSSNHRVEYWKGNQKDFGEFNKCWAKTKILINGKYNLMGQDIYIYIYWKIYP